MAKKLILISAFLLLTGCATKTVYVEVPPKEPPLITRPQLDTDYLKQGSTPGDVIQAHRLTIRKLQQWGIELETALDAYRKDNTK